MTEPEPARAAADVSVLVVSYRTKELTLACLRSLAETTLEHRYEVICVDNNSMDGSVEAMERELPWVRCIALSENRGFGAAVNLAASQARGEYLLLLNPDAVVHPGAVDVLVRFAKERPEHGLYGGQTLDGHGLVDPRSVWGLPTHWSQLCWALGLSALRPRSALFDPETLGPWNRDSIREVPAVIGALLLIRADLWQKLGGFDEGYFMYSEDIDLSVRARALGWRPVMTPHARITHLVGASSGAKSERTLMVLKGRVTLMRKHWTPWSFALGRGVLLAGVMLRAAAEVMQTLVGRRSGPRHWTVVAARSAAWLPGWAPTTVGADVGA